MRDGEPLSTWPSYCGKPHRTEDGLPLSHRCRVLPPEALRAAANGEEGLALRLYAGRAAAGELEGHAGVWKVRRGR
jgi:hypothetical protein